MEDKYNKVIDLLTDLLLQDKKVQDILMKAKFYDKDDVIVSVGLWNVMRTQLVLKKIY